MRIIILLSKTCMETHLFIMVDFLKTPLNSKAQKQTIQNTTIDFLLMEHKQAICVEILY